MECGVVKERRKGRQGKSEKKICFFRWTTSTLFQEAGLHNNSVFINREMKETLFFFVA